MKLVNVHCHMLYGVDDGAKKREECAAMLEAAYNDDIRAICMTPHYNPEFFNVDRAEIIEHFKWAAAYSADHFPDLRLFIGQEIFYHSDCVNTINSGECMSLNGTRHVLVEFSPYSDYTALFSGLSNLLTSGYIPVLAHVERYSSLFSNQKRIEELCDLGVVIQVNAGSVSGKRGFLIKRFINSLIKSDLVHIVADDCHDMSDKPPGLSDAYNFVCRKHGAEVGQRLFHDNPLRVLSNR